MKPLLIYALTALCVSGVVMAGERPWHFSPDRDEVLVLVIENDDLAQIRYPDKGVIRQRYLPGNEVNLQSFGAAVVLEGQVAVAVRRGREGRVIERFRDPLTRELAVTYYYFDGKKHGRWRRELGAAKDVVSGSFVLRRLPADEHGGEARQHRGQTVVLSLLRAESVTLPDGSFPIPGSVVLQSYAADGSYRGQGFGQGTVGHHGRYELSEVAEGVLVEKTTQIIPQYDNYTAPFTMVYVYETPYSGRWMQNYGNGLIHFGGYFTVHATEY